LGTPGLKLRLIGGPTALIEYGGLRLLTDPTLDPPGDHPRPGTQIVLRKLAGPAIPIEELPQIDAVLLSHDHHVDNLDDAGRAFLPRAGRVLTTRDGAERLDVDAAGLEPRQSVELDRAVRVTALPAEHGPPPIAARNGPVIGFLLRGDGLPTVYVSGDNASVDVVRAIVAEHGPIDIAVLFAGGAQVPGAWGEAYLTLTAETAAQAAGALGEATIVPIHQDGWGHLAFGPEDVRRAFDSAGLAARLRLVAPGEEIEL
jgi:L-ascorbate metabolism protein UlaG (beta-lactamase superfamily)